MKLLLVDDDDDLRSALAGLLRDDGYEVEEASGGSAALELLETWRPDVIVLDYMMPVMSGAEFRRAQLATDAISKIPVVVVTAAARCPEVARMEAAAVLHKPFDLVALEKCVDAVGGPALPLGDSAGPQERRDKVDDIARAHGRAHPI